MIWVKIENGGRGVWGSQADIHRIRKNQQVKYKKRKQIGPHEMGQKSILKSASQKINGLT